MRIAFRPPQTTGNTSKVPTVDMNGRSKAWEGAEESEVVTAIANRLQGAVRAAIGIAPLPIMSNPARCMAKNTRSTAIQYAAAIFVGVVRINFDIVGRSVC
jgi:hypothetical protein